MKKTILLSFILAAATASAEAQTVSRCTYADPVKKIIEKTDSLGLLFRQMQQHNKTAWSEFVKSAEAGKGLTAFDTYGSAKENWARDYMVLHEGVVAELRQLVKAVDPDDRLPDDKFLAVIKEAFDCFIADKPAIDLKEVATIAGRQAPPDIGTQLGPCDQALRACVADARDVRLQSLNACGITGTSFLLALKKILASWISGGAALLCYISASVVYNGSVDVCIGNYIDCMGH